MYTEIYCIKDNLYLNLIGTCNKNEIDKLNVKIVDLVNHLKVKNIIINVKNLDISSIS